MTAKCIWCHKELPERGKLKEGLKESICLECLDEALTLAGSLTRKEAQSEKRREKRPVAATHS